MVHRDPETGKFVSSAAGGGDCWEDLTILVGDVTHRVDAADLSGGNQLFGSGAANAPLFDFGDILGEHDVGEIVSMYVKASLYGPTTATAESFIRGHLQLRTEPSEGDVQVGKGLSGAHHTEDSIDTKSNGRNEDEILWATSMFGVTNFNDTVNATGGGPGIGESEVNIEFRNIFGGGPVLDDDDEIYAPVAFETDNISDHRVFAELTAVAAVKEWDYEECPVLGRR